MEVQNRNQMKNSALIESSLDLVPEGMQIIGPDWKYLYINAAAAKQGKYPREELLGHTMMEKYPGIEHSPLFGVLKECMTEGAARQMENEFSYPDGTKGWFEICIRPLPEGIFVLSMDITERKNKESALRAVALNTETRINELLNVLLRFTLMDFSQKAEISTLGDELDAVAVGLNTLGEELQGYIQLVEDANKQLLIVNKELEAFSYSVSHDLRAPLRAVNGFAQMLSEEYKSKLDDEGKRILEIIKHNATKMGTLIDELLAFSRLGRKEIKKSKINMNTLLEDVIRDLDKSIPHRAEIKFNQLHGIKADPVLIRQALFNLVSNAIKYSSKKEGPMVEIFSEQKNGEIIFSVKDNGAGFDMRYINKLFGVFQRLHSQDEFEGTGVGLAIVQRIITKHGGRVWAEGKVDEGAIFNFSINN